MQLGEQSPNIYCWKKFLMTKLEKRLFVTTNIIISIQGIIYFYFKYFMQSETPFGARPHGFTSTMLHLHILLVPFLIIGLGYLLSIHILPKLKLKKSSRRKSGIALLITLILSILSGYLLQMGFELKTSQMIGWLHIGISFIWILLFTWHLRAKL